METLVLNKAAIPVSVVSIRRAIVLVTTGKAIALKNYEDKWFHSSSYISYDPILMKSKNSMISIMVPSVIQCFKSEHLPKKYTNILPFNRRNVFIRDAGKCQYCGKKVTLNSFTFDHVTPQCRGGTTFWDNIVVSCLRCNGQKGRKSLKHYHRELIRKPYIPRLDKAAPAYLVNKVGMEIPEKSWEDYIYWRVELLP